MKSVKLLLCLLFIAGTATAQHHKPKIDRTEQGLIYRVLGTLRDKDTRAYSDLFPDLDTFSKLVMKNLDSNAPGFRRMAFLQDHPDSMMYAEQELQNRLMDRFDSIIARGTALGIAWDRIVPVRFELEKMIRTRDTLLEKIMPDRYLGYAFFMDMSSRTNYVLTLTDMVQIKGEWYGGMLQNFYEGQSVDDFYQQQIAARRRNERGIIIPKDANGQLPDMSSIVQRHKEAAAMLTARRGAQHGMQMQQSLAQTEPAADTTSPPTAQKQEEAQADVAVSTPPPPKPVERSAPVDDIPKPTTDDAAKKETPEKLIVARKLYTGKLDNEISVQLYLRGISGPCKKPVCTWEGIYKFGDDPFINVTVIAGEDGKWVISDSQNNGTMELQLSGKTFTGTWMNNSDQNGYDARLTEQPTEQKKINRLDETFSEINQ